MSDQIDTEVKLAIYRVTADTGVVPTSAEVARKIDVEEAEVLDAFARLHKKRLLVPEPGDFSRIRMASPFSEIATAFPVETVNSWCEARGIPRRPLISLAQLWQLAHALVRESPDC
jgi:hypothetical protein